MPGRVQVSLVVPARNEEACLGACLESLIGQSGISFKIIVVDDGSSDRTAEIAASFAQVRVVHPQALPPGHSVVTIFRSASPAANASSGIFRSVE